MSRVGQGAGDQQVSWSAPGPGGAPVPRDPREVIREEHLMRRRVLEVLRERPCTIPEIAQALDLPSHEVVTWVMGMRKYGQVTEIKEPTDEGFYLYQAVLKDEEAEEGAR